MSAQVTILSILLTGGALLSHGAAASDRPQTAYPEAPCAEYERRLIDVLDRQTRLPSTSFAAARQVEERAQQLTQSREFVDYLRCLSEQ